MRKWLIALLVSVTVVTASWAHNIKVPAHYIKSNFGPGYCTWVTIDSACRYVGDRRCTSMTRWRLSFPRNTRLCLSPRECTVGPSNYGSLYDAQKELRRRGVSFTYQPDYTYDWKRLRRSTRPGGTGTVISLEPRNRNDDGHTVWITGSDSRGVTVQDTNYPGRPYRMSWGELRKQWAGGALTIHRPRAR